jgi:hypothetical protein
LKVIGYRFRLAEIPHAVRHFKPHLFGNPEKVVDGVPTGENNGGIVPQVYLLLAHLFGIYPLDVDEGPEIDLHFFFVDQL